MLLYRTKKRIRRVVLALIAVLVLLALIIIGANSQAHRGSRLPVLLDRTLGPFVRDWTGDWYRDTWGELRADKLGVQGYHLLEKILWDPFRFQRLRLEERFHQWIDYSFENKKSRLRQIAQKLEIQSILGDKIAREIEPPGTARWILDGFWADVSFIEGALLIRNRWGNNGPWYKAGRPGKFTPELFEKLRDQPGRVVFGEGARGSAWLAQPVRDLNNTKRLGFLVIRFRLTAFQDLAQFRLPDSPLAFGLFAPRMFEGKTEWVRLGGMGLSRSGPHGPWLERAGRDIAYTGPRKTGFAELTTSPPTGKKKAAGDSATTPQKMDRLIHWQTHPAGFGLMISQPARTWGFFTFRILAAVFVLFALFFSYRAIRYLIAWGPQLWHQWRQRREGDHPLNDALATSLETTRLALEGTREGMESLRQSLDKPVVLTLGETAEPLLTETSGAQKSEALPVSPGNFPSPRALGQLSQHLEQLARGQEELHRRLDRMAGDWQPGISLRATRLPRLYDSLIYPDEVQRIDLDLIAGHKDASEGPGANREEGPPTGAGPVTEQKVGAEEAPAEETRSPGPGTAAPENGALEKSENFASRKEAAREAAETASREQIDILSPVGSPVPAPELDPLESLDEELERELDEVVMGVGEEGFSSLEPEKAGGSEESVDISPDDLEILRLDKTEFYQVQSDFRAAIKAQREDRERRNRVDARENLPEPETELAPTLSQETPTDVADPITPGPHEAEENQSAQPEEKEVPGGQPRPQKLTPGDDNKDTPEPDAPLLLEDEEAYSLPEAPKFVFFEENLEKQIVEYRGLEEAEIKR